MKQILKDLFLQIDSIQKTTAREDGDDYILNGSKVKSSPILSVDKNMDYIVFYNWWWRE